jgi:regulatory protein
MTMKERGAKSASEKAMDYLARRSHSELELRQKLSRTYGSLEVEAAIAYAKENGWMTEPAELSERVAIELRRKHKGVRFINQFLKNKGLPSVAKDPDEEVSKAIEVIESKLRTRLKGEFGFEEQQKVYRWLATRGFDEETIRQAISRTKEQTQ